MVLLVRPNINDSTTQSKLSQGLGHHSYGEPAWPNDLLYMFSISILGVITAIIGFAVLDPTLVDRTRNSYVTAHEILLEWSLVHHLPVDSSGVNVINKPQRDLRRASWLTSSSSARPACVPQVIPSTKNAMGLLLRHSPLMTRASWTTPRPSSVLSSPLAASKAFKQDQVRTKR
jgi:hypothetical protein